MSGGAHLRRRGDGSTELRVNGVFVMDDVETGSERLLAAHVLDLGARSVLVGGLGLGFTLRELLAGDVDHVVVAELEPKVVDWMRSGRIAGGDLLTDPRVDLHVADVVDVVTAQPPHSLDAIVLDIDNGPDFLVHERNAAVYGDAFIGICADRLHRDGTLAVWSMADSQDLRATVGHHFNDVTAIAVPVVLQDRSEKYWLICGRGARGARASQL